MIYENDPSRLSFYRPLSVLHSKKENVTEDFFLSHTDFKKYPKLAFSEEFFIHTDTYLFEPISNDPTQRKPLEWRIQGFFPLNVLPKLQKKLELGIGKRLSLPNSELSSRGIEITNLNLEFKEQ